MVQPDPIPSTKPAYKPQLKRVRLPKPRRRQHMLLRSLGIVMLFTCIALGYLCSLIRVMQVDMECQRLRDMCRKKEAEIGSLRIKLAALKDARRLEEYAREEGLVPLETGEEIAVSPDVCPVVGERVAEYAEWESSTPRIGPRLLASP